MSRYPTAQEVKASVLLSDVIRKDVKLQGNGKDEWIGLCPFHSESTGSFRVYDNDGTGGHYHCYGCDAHGDVISYLEHTRKMGINAAKDHLTGGRTELVAIHRPCAMEEPADDDRGLERVDATIAPLIIAGEPNRVWSPTNQDFASINPLLVHPYRDENGKLLGYTYRTAAKKAMPLQFCNRPDAPAVVPMWTMVGFVNPRPLYGLDRLRIGKTVVIVEGEKDADNLQAYKDKFDWGKDYVALTYSGGVGNIHLSNWEPLTGYDVILWPDKDDAGHKAVYGDGKKKGILQILDGIAASIKVVVPHDDLPNKGDCSDAIDLMLQIGDILKGAGHYHREPEPEAAVPIETIVPRPPKVKQAASKLDGNPFFRFLGFDAGKYFFIPKAGGQLREYSATQLNSVPCLFELAPPNFWIKNYSTDAAKPSFKAEAVQLAMFDMMQSSIAKGIFDPMRVRGKGWWRDGKDMLIHLGDRIYIAGDTLDVEAYSGNYIYQNAKASHADMKNPMDLEETGEILNLLTMFPFTDKRHEIYLAGLMVTGMTSGAMEWRPHGWVTGQAASGKSTLIRKLYMPLMGDFSSNYGAGSTVAGIAQDLNKNSLMVSIDEAEAENRRDGDLRMRGILALMRSSSSTADGQTEVKGTGGVGGAVHRQVRSQFLLASIDKIQLVPADVSRITCMELSSNLFTHTIEDVEAAIATTITPDFCQRFAGRCLLKCEDILRAIPIWRVAMMSHVENNRTALQLGTLLAGYWTLISDEAITKEAAEAFIAQYSWMDMRISAASNTDDREFFARLLAATILFTDERSNTRRESISYLLRIAMGKWEAEDMVMNQDTAKAVLRENGIGVIGSDFGAVHFARNSQKIKDLMINTKWANGYQSSIESMRGCIKGSAAKNYRIEGAQQRCITIPDFWKYIGEFMG